MGVPIVGQPTKRTIADVIQEYLDRYQRKDNTQAQDRQALAALILVVEGLIRKQMTSEGVDPTQVQLREITAEEAGEIEAAATAEPAQQQTDPNGNNVP